MDIPSPAGTDATVYSLLGKNLSAGLTYSANTLLGIIRSE